MNRFRLYNPPLIVEQRARCRWSGEGGVSSKKLLGKKMNADKTVVGSDLTVAGYT